MNISIPQKYFTQKKTGKEPFPGSASFYFPFPCFRWRTTGSLMYPRQGAQIAVLGGRPTVMGGFHDYDKYPDMVEQFDVDTGEIIELLEFLKQILLKGIGSL